MSGRKSTHSVASSIVTAGGRPHPNKTGATSSAPLLPKKRTRNNPQYRSDSSSEEEPEVSSDES